MKVKCWSLKALYGAERDKKKGYVPSANAVVRGTEKRLWREEVKAAASSRPFSENCG